MRKIDFIMGMPVIIEIVDSFDNEVFEEIFDYFREVDEKCSPYKATSEVTIINNSKSEIKTISADMKLVLELANITKQETNGYFDIYRNNYFDPSGIVKGWAIYNASKILIKKGFKNFYIDAGGDIQASGKNGEGKKWTIGIRNPFKTNENVKIVYLSGKGIATSGTYEKGNHIYNPKAQITNEIVSLTVIGKNVYEADRFSTPAFAMGVEGINFVEKQKNLEGYMIDSNGIGTMTTGFEKDVKNHR